MSGVPSLDTVPSLQTARPSRSSGGHVKTMVFLGDGFLTRLQRSPRRGGGGGGWVCGGPVKDREVKSRYTVVISNGEVSFSPNTKQAANWYFRLLYLSKKP